MVENKNSKSFRLAVIVMVSSLSLIAFAGCDAQKASEEAAKVIEMTDSKEVMEKQEEKTEETKEVTRATGPRYRAYADVVNPEAEIGKGPVALYFTADWCSTCQKIKGNVKQDIASFPEGTNIVEVNFDDSKGLRERFGVDSQTTFIVLNKDGEVVKKLSVPTNGDLKDAIEKSL